MQHKVVSTKLKIRITRMFSLTEGYPYVCSYLSYVPVRTSMLGSTSANSVLSGKLIGSFIFYYNYGGIEIYNVNIHQARLDKHT